MNRNTIVRNLVRPFIERLGTMAAAYFIARGLDSEMVAQAANFLVAFLCVVLELVVSSIGRERDVSRAYMEGRFPDAQDRY